MHILVAEDNDDDALLLRRYLQRQYGPDLVMTVVANRSELNAALANTTAPDVVLVDINMPYLNIGDVCCALDDLGIDAPIIVLSGSISDEQAGDLVRSAARDYISKDAAPHRLVPAINRERATVEDRQTVFDSAFAAFAQAEEFRDPETAGHVRRVTDLAVQFARAYGITNVRQLRVLRYGASLHDIGKIGIPDAVLMKAGPLTPEEWVVMKTHPDIAHRWLVPFFAPFPVLREVPEIPYCHHEQWGGNGYPQGLAGEAIPLSARLFTLADVYEALTADRRYRVAWPPAQALAYLQTGAGTMFDPQLVPVFVRMIEAQEAAAA